MYIVDSHGRSCFVHLSHLYASSLQFLQYVSSSCIFVGVASEVMKNIEPHIRHSEHSYYQDPGWSFRCIQVDSRCKLLGRCRLYQWPPQVIEDIRKYPEIFPLEKLLKHYKKSYKIWSFARQITNEGFFYPFFPLFFLCFFLGNSPCWWRVPFWSQTPRQGWRHAPGEWKLGTLMGEYPPPRKASERTHPADSWTEGVLSTVFLVFFLILHWKVKEAIQ